VLDVLLVLNFLLHVLVTLQNLVVFHFAELETLVHASLQFLLERVHFVALLAHQVCLTCQNLLVHVHHELLTFLFFQILGARLHDVGLLVILLLSEVGLHLSEVEKFGTLLILVGQLSLKTLPVLF
jgi:hypothetical protein